MAAFTGIEGSPEAGNSAGGCPKRSPDARRLATTWILDHPSVLALWLGVVGLSLAWLEIDLRARNAAIPRLMRWVWRATVLYSGALGLLVYAFSGRRQIARDTLWRRGWRSVAHCYAGCGAGEVVGVFVAAGLLGLGNLAISAVSFGLAYVAGFALTVGPLVEEGIPLRRAARDAFFAETISITVMEVTAITVGLLLGVSAGLAAPRFWMALYVSLTAGLLAAYPVNVLLIHLGVKEGMHDPRHMPSGA